MSIGHEAPGTALANGAPDAQAASEYLFRLGRVRFRVKDLFTVFIIAILAAAVIIASQWVLRASIIVLVLGGLGLVLATAQLLLDTIARSDRFRKQVATYELPSFDRMDRRSTVLGSLEIWGWLIGVLVLIGIVGLPLALPLFVLVYVKFYGGGWVIAACLALAIAGFIFGIYNQIMHVYWPASLLGGFLPGM